MACYILDDIRESFNCNDIVTTARDNDVAIPADRICLLAFFKKFSQKLFSA